MPLSLIPKSLPTTLSVLFRLSRANMTTISAVTYLAGSTLPSTSSSFCPLLFLRGYLFVLLTQICTHFLGELYDLSSDRLNSPFSALTGGSRVLVEAPWHVPLARRAALCALLADVATIAFVLPSAAKPLAALMFVLAVSYSAPPLKLNHRALGELDAAYITSVLVPYFGATVQGAFPAAFPWFHSSLAILVVPPLFVKFALFLLFNMADRRADWAAGKVTLAVVLGDAAVVNLVAACFLATFVAVLVIMVTGRDETHAGLFVLPSACVAWRIWNKLKQKGWKRADHVLGLMILFSTWMVWAVLMAALLAGKGDIWVGLFAAIFGCITVMNVIKGKGRMKKSYMPDVEEKRMEGQNLGALQCGGECLPQLVNNTTDLRAQPKGDLLMAAEEGMVGENSPCAVLERDVVVVGGGVGGLIAAAVLAKLGRSVIVLERRQNAEEAEMGADLALWPGAIAILKELGVDNRFFDTECFPLETVHMCNMDFDKIALGAAATVLKTIDMGAVTEGTGEHFVLVPRQSLMDAIRALVPQELVVYGVDVLLVEEDEDNGEVTTTFSVKDGAQLPLELAQNAADYSVKSRVVIGADGSRSRLRSHVSPTHGGVGAVRFCGEVCYRGVLNLAENEGIGATDAPNDALPVEVRDRVTSLFPDAPGDRTMRINYGAGLRSSFGYMSADGNVAYWWVKVQTETMPQNRAKLEHCDWPEPLKTLHDITPEPAFYMHAIEDSTSLPKWSTPRLVLVGDAAHVVTPNMGQGACLATEDSFVLAVELASYWKWPDGHLEAFYNYERCRRPYAEAVAAESRKQLFLGQLSSRPAVYLRELLLQLVPIGVLQKTLKKNNFAVRPYLERFQEMATQATT